MLECNAIEGQVDEATYTHIIRMWVKDVRDRSEQSSPVPLEVTAISDSEVEGGGRGREGGRGGGRGRKREGVFV